MPSSDSNSTSRAPCDHEAPALRVANVIEESRYGGPQRRIALVAEKLKSHNIETVVICSRMGADRFLEELTARGIPCRVLPLHRITRNPPELLAAILLFPGETLRLARLLRRERFDLVHCNGSWQWKGVLAGWLSRTPIVWHLNDTNVPGVIHFIFRRLAKLASGFIVAGERVRQYYLKVQDLGTRPIFEIQAPVDCASFSEQGELDVEIDALPGIKVLTIANINPAKGLDTLVAVAARFKAQTDLPVSFVVVGQRLHSQQGYFLKLKELNAQLGADNLHFAGPRSDIPACLRAADIGLCCSVAEASPMAVWETAAAGLPLVATDVGDIEMLNKQWQFAYVTSIGDVESIAKAIQKLAANTEEAAQIGKNGARMARKVLDIDVCVTLHAKAYRSLQVFCSQDAA